MSGARSGGDAALTLERCRCAAIAQLDERVFAGLACVGHGIVVLKGAESWGAHERGYIELPGPSGAWHVPVAYDEREAPYPCMPDGGEQTDLLLSLTDEDDYLACVWARMPEGSPLRGVGVDLSATSHFAPREAGRRDYSALLFTEHERELAAQVDPDPLLARAVLFGAKEAAFKATAAPLRRWYEEHDDELLYEVRHFVMDEPGYERGSGRNAAAQVAMERMGIERVRVMHALVHDMALVVALALGKPRA